jgi:hypothetical protein
LDNCLSKTLQLRFSKIFWEDVRYNLRLAFLLIKTVGQLFIGLLLNNNIHVNWLELSLKHGKDERDTISRHSALKYAGGVHSFTKDIILKFLLHYSKIINFIIMSYAY